MACTCTNNNSVSLDSGTQFLGTASFITCDAGEQPAFASVVHNNQVATPGSSPIAMGAGTIGIVNGTLSLTGVPPGTYNVTLNFTGSAGQGGCQHFITVQGGNSLQCTNGNGSLPAGGTLLVEPDDVQFDATGFSTNISQIVAGQSNGNATSWTNPGNDNQGILFTGLLAGQSNLVRFRMQDGSICTYELNVTGGGGGGGGGGNTGNCRNASITCSQGDTINVVPGDVQTGATEFDSNPADIVQGEPDPDNATAVTGATPFQVTISCDSPGTTVFTLRMANGDDCQFTVIVQASNNAGCTCTNATSVSLSSGDQALGTTSFASCSGGAATFVSLLYNNQTATAAGNGSVQAGGGTIGFANDALVFSGVAPGQYPITFTLNDGASDFVCGHTVTVQGDTGQTLACASGIIGPITPGSSIPVTAWVTGGSSPYSIATAPSGGPVSGTIGQTSINVAATAAAGTYPIAVGVRDGNGNVVNCEMMVQVVTASSSQCDVSRVDNGDGTWTITNTGTLAITLTQTVGTTWGTFTLQPGQQRTSAVPAGTTPCFTSECC